jgi:hypothetical protein
MSPAQLRSAYHVMSLWSLFCAIHSIGIKGCRLHCDLSLSAACAIKECILVSVPPNLTPLSHMILLQSGLLFSHARPVDPSLWGPLSHSLVNKSPWIKSTNSDMSTSPLAVKLGSVELPKPPC